MGKIRVIWSPKEDITAYELARMIGVFNIRLDEKLLDTLPESVKRNYRIVPEEQHKELSLWGKTKIYIENIIKR
jgi:hypothetical protein